MWYQYKYWKKQKTCDGTLALYIAALSPFSEYIFIMKPQRLGGLSRISFHLCKNARRLTYGHPYCCSTAADEGSEPDTWSLEGSI